MSKHLGNRIGFGVSSYSDGGLFNLSSQSFLLRKQKWVSKAVISGGNATFSPGNGYTYTVFTGTGPLTISGGEIYIDYAVIAGGATGASGSGLFSDTSGGGGGAGGFLEGNTLFYPGPYTITVGGSTSNSSISGPSLFVTKTAIAGGVGGVWPQPVSGNPGGSGGGGGGGTSQYHGGDGTIDQGTPGGYCAILSFASGGGGGAGGAGTPGTSPGPGGPGGNGGNGRRAFLGDSGIPPSYGTPGPTPGRFFAGGGGGASPGTAGSGGSGGGGSGGIPSATAPLRNGTAGTLNTGGGGGGGAASPGGGSGGSGGSGIVILRYINYT